MPLTADQREAADAVDTWRAHGGRGKVVMSRAAWESEHTDFRNTDAMQPQILALCPQTGATVSVPVHFSEWMENATAWNRARIIGRRVFYEQATETIRQCPENYCLAIRSVNKPGEWVAAPDRASIINGHSLSEVLRQTRLLYPNATPEKVAVEIERGFWGEVPR